VCCYSTGSLSSLLALYSTRVQRTGKLMQWIQVTKQTAVVPWRHTCADWLTARMHMGLFLQRTQTTCKWTMPALARSLELTADQVIPTGSLSPVSSGQEEEVKQLTVHWGGLVFAVWEHIGYIHSLLISTHLYMD